LFLFVFATGARAAWSLKTLMSLFTFWSAVIAATPRFAVSLFGLRFLRNFGHIRIFLKRKIDLTLFNIHHTDGHAGDVAHFVAET
jgi:hypothetical protein